MQGVKSHKILEFNKTIEASRLCGNPTKKAAIGIEMLKQ